jgi:hypothetical protein
MVIDEYILKADGIPPPDPYLRNTGFESGVFTEVSGE